MAKIGDFFNDCHSFLGYLWHYETFPLVLVICGRSKNDISVIFGPFLVKNGHFWVNFAQKS